MAATMEQKIINTLKSSGKTPLQKRILIKKANIKKTEIKYLNEALEKLIDDGTIINSKTSYVLSKNLGYLPATVVKINETFGFVHVDDEAEDTFVAGRFLKGAMPTDRVLIKKYKGRGQSDEGEVVSIFSEKDQEFTGTFIKKDGRGYVVSDNFIKTPLQVIVSPSLLPNEGDKVLAKIATRGSRHYNHRVKIIEIFGKAEDAVSSCNAILKLNGVSTVFSDEVLREADAVSALKITDKDFSSRLNLIDETIFTMDGADTKDIDDAVSLTKHENGYALGIHIADVSHYLRYGSEMDKEAYKRGTSIYYADSVIPMLPKQLSNGICSLNPDEVRLAFSALISLDKEGNIIGYNFKKTIIRSRLKGVYSEINKILDGTATDEIKKKYYGLEKTLENMRELAKILNNKRKNKGGFDIDSDECKIILDENKRIVDIVPRTQGISENIIEEFMICANEAAATLAKKAKLPFLYRVHEDPPARKVEALKEICQSIGINTANLGEKISATDLSNLLKQAKGTPKEKIINEQVLRTMAKAKYDHKNIGHFGLVLENYSHFTSPIRRYPDTVIHRILSAYVAGTDKGKIIKRYEKYVPQAGTYLSECELRAMNIERQCEDCYKAEYMRSEIGNVFNGVISSVAPHGVYVELQNTVEGMIHMSKLPGGTFAFDGKVSAVDKNNGKKYSVGDEARIRVVSVDVSAGKIDFEIA
ncbi:MAG: ribonuclease R [Oscillospiraceae bacterium]